MQQPKRPARQTTAQRQQDILRDIVRLAARIGNYAADLRYAAECERPTPRQLAALQRRLSSIVAQLQDAPTTQQKAPRSDDTMRNDDGY